MANEHKAGYLSIDPAALLDAVAGDVAACAQLMNTFLRIAPPMLARLGQAVASEDLARAMQESHSLKGSVSLLGASRLADMLQNLETQTRRSDKQGLASRFREIHSEFETVMLEAHACFQRLAAAHEDSSDERALP